MLLVRGLFRVDRAGEREDRRQGLRALQTVGPVTVRQLDDNLGRVDDDVVTALVLRPVQRAVCELHQFLAGFRLVKVTNSGRHRQVRGDADRGGAELRCATLGDCTRPVSIGLGKQQRELVAADPAENVSGAGAVLEKGCRLHQGRVSRLVAVGIVNALEVIEVEQHERKRPVIALRALNLGFDPLLEGAMIQETSQRIAGGLGQEVRARVRICDCEPGEVGEDAEPLLDIPWQLLLRSDDNEQGPPQLAAHADRDGDSRQRHRSHVPV
jgi:hypothetical protein